MKVKNLQNSCIAKTTFKRNAAQLISSITHPAVSLFNVLRIQDLKHFKVYIFRSRLQMYVEPIKKEDFNMKSLDFGP